MRTLKQIEQLRRLHNMILQENTGNPKSIAEKMRISERQVYNLIDQLKTMDAPVRFNRRTNTYYYAMDFELLVSISIKVIQGDEVLEIYAGKQFSNTSAYLQGLCSPLDYLGQVITF